MTTHVSAYGWDSIGGESSDQSRRARSVERVALDGCRHRALVARGVDRSDRVRVPSDSGRRVDERGSRGRADQHRVAEDLVGDEALLIVGAGLPAQVDLS